MLVATANAWAGPKDEARELAGEGISLYEQGDYASAIDKLEQADELFKAPVHSVYLARSLVKLRRLLEAEAAYQRAAQVPVTDGEPESFAPARKAAREELRDLQPRIPVVRVEVPEGSRERVRITLDDQPLEDWSHVRVDPGAHVIGFQLGDGPASTQAFEAAEGGEECVRVNVVDPERGTVAPSSGDGHMLWPGLAFGIGGFGLVLGAVTGGIALAKASDVKDQCPNDVCPSADVAEDAGTADTLGTVALASLITGGVGMVLGVTLVFVLDDGEAAVSLAPNGLTFSARF